MILHRHLAVMSHNLPSSVITHATQNEQVNTLFVYTCTVAQKQQTAESSGTSNFSAMGKAWSGLIRFSYILIRYNNDTTSE